MDRVRVEVVACCTTVLVAFSSSFATADIVYNNLGPGDTFSVGGRILVGPDNGAFGNINQAASFSVGPTAHYLTDVVLGLGVTDMPASPLLPRVSTSWWLPMQPVHRV